tara:strand:- start:2705 stop:3253 length:549 start_codon:yes stop_codon:yes gene_type:complete
MTDLHPLSHTWKIWEHRNDCENYEDNINSIGEFDTVELFWKYWVHIPKPGAFFFTNKRNRGIIGGRSVVSYSVFKKGIFPKWEDPVASLGGEWRIRRFKNIDEVDEIWENVVLLTIGSSLEMSEHILGVRVVDSSHPETNKTMYNVEIWFDSMNYAEEIKANLGQSLNNLDVSKLYLRNHSD